MAPVPCRPMRAIAGRGLETTGSDRHDGTLKLPAMVTAAALCLGAMPALGETSPSPGDDPQVASLDDLGLGDLDIDIGDELALLHAEDLDVVVSATRHAQPIDESPSAITVIGREEILASGYDNLVDLMRLVPGADVSRVTQLQGAVGARTRSTLASNLLLVLVDGRDVSLHMFGQPIWMSMPFDVESIERIEFIRGPGSTLYGANAYQGVVNIVTRRPTDGPIVGEATVSGAGATTHQADIRAQGRLGEVGLWASVGYDSRAPYRETDARSFRLGRARSLATWEPVEGVQAVVEAGVVASEGTIVTPVGTGIARSIWPYLRGAIDTEKSELLVVLERNDLVMDLDFRVVLPDDDEAGGQVLIEAPRLRMPTQSLEVAGQHTVLEAAGHRLTAGGSARLIHHRPEPFVDCPEVPAQHFEPEDCRPLEMIEPRLGVFVQDEWRLTDVLTATTGLRLDWNAINPQLGLSPRMALVWRMVEGQSLRLAAGRAYRKPTFLESHGRLLPEPAEGVPGDVTRRLQHLFATGIGNPALGNEHVDALELGWRGRFAEGRAAASVETFVARHGDTIEAYTENLEFTEGLGGVPVLHPDARMSHANSSLPRFSYGGEALVEVRPLPRGLLVRGTYALDLQYELQPVEGEADAQWVRHQAWEPAHRLGGTIRWTSPLGLHASVDAFWMSRYTTRTLSPVSALLPREEDTPGATTLVNGSVGYRTSLGTGEIDVGATAFNLAFQPVREVGGTDPLVEHLDPRLRLYVRGRF